MANYNFADANHNKSAKTWMLFRKLFICWGIIALIPVFLVFIYIRWWDDAGDSDEWFPIKRSEEIRYLCQGGPLANCGTNGKSISSGCLLLVEVKETQLQASRKCIGMGLRLATAKTEAANKEINDLYHKDSPFWFGLYKQSGTWKWMDTNAKIVYSNFHDDVETDDNDVNGAVWGMHDWAQWVMVVLWLYFGVSLCFVSLSICISFGLYFMASDGLMARNGNKICCVLTVDGLCACLGILSLITAIWELVIQETVAAGLYVGWVCIGVLLLLGVLYFGSKMRTVVTEPQVAVAEPVGVSVLHVVPSLSKQ